MATRPQHHRLDTSNHSSPSNLRPCALALGIGAALGLAALNNAAHADDAVLNPVVVTATRTTEQLQSVLAPMSVLERADIERLQSRDFNDLISHLPGVDISRDGGPGALSSLYLRGTNSNHTLFLIDGQRVSSATLGSTNFQFLDPQQIEKIEVVRGPKSSLYGSDAIGGVVQIFTRRSTAAPSSYVTAGYGDNNSYEVATGTQGRAEQLRYSAHLSQYFTNGISNLRDNTPPNSDHDLYRNSSISLNVGYDFDGGVSLDLNHFYTRAKNEYDDSVFFDGVGEPYAKNWIQNTNALLQAPLTSIWNTSLSVGRSIDDTDSYDKLELTPDARTDFRTTRDSASWQNDFTLAEQQTATLGVDYYDDKVDASSLYIDPENNHTVRSRDNTGYFAQYLLTQGDFDLQAGLRLDDNEAFGRKTTRDFAAGLKLPGQHKLTLSYGTAFKAPTFNDLYFPPDSFGDVGNPNLKPESSENYEIGLRGDYTTFQWSLNVYENKVDDLIVWGMVDPLDYNKGFMPDNVAKAKIRGAELVGSARLQEWLISGSLNYVDPRDEDTDNLLPKRARRSAKLDADRSFGPWGVGASWRAQSDRYGDSANSHVLHLGGYGLLDLRTSYKFSESWSAQLTVSNVLDKRYVLNRTYDGVNSYDYNQPRTGWFGSLTYRL